MFISIITWITVIGVLLQVNGHGSSDQEFHRCESDEHLEYALSHDPEMRGRIDAIEAHWRQNPNHDGHQVDFRRRLQSLPSPLVIPINFIITKGPSDAYTGYEQIISQIRVLNQDFQGSNPDKGQNGRGATSEFSNKAGNFNIRFSLNKIKRKDTTIQGFANADMMLESTGGQNNDDPEHALNFWVNALSNGALGWTYGPGVSWQYDGVVQRPDAVGSKAYDRNDQWTILGAYNLGRTATHEIGHWLNLHHIWGPGASGCGSANDDLVSDTPDQEKSYGGCPADGTNSCGTNDMYMNYMDYTNDNCMNMFTIGQIDRGDDLFLAGGHRVKLLDYVSNPTDVAFIDYFYFVNGNGAQCDNGHTRRDLNLNEGAGGDYIYLCISYSNNPYVDVITDISILTGGSSAISCNAGYEKIDSNLNEDAGGDHIYVCYKKESRQASSPIITDLYPFAFDSAYSSSTYNGCTLELVNLNKGAGGKYIYLGSKGKSSTTKSPNYFKGPQALKYSDAAAYCQSQGTKLASIGTVTDWNDAVSVCTTNNNDCWIGLRDDLNGNDDNVWAWDDGIDITKSYGFNTDRTATKGQAPWASGEPNELGQEDCAQIYRNNGRYNDAPCGSLYHPLCNKARIEREYFKGPTQLNYGAASTYCTSQGATLASIVTQTEWDKAKSVCGANDCYIGLRDDITDMIWSWDDGSRISNSYGFNSDGSATTGQGPWHNGEPNQWNGIEEDCVDMDSTGKYNDVPCDILNYPLCSRIGNGQSGAAKSVHEQVSYYPKKNNIGDLINMNMYYGQDNNYKQYSNNEDWKGTNINNNDNWMDIYHEQDNNDYREYPDNYNYGEDKTNNNDYNYNINGIEISTNMLILIICGLMIINIICLAIYFIDNNKCKLNKKQRGYKVVKYESEDRQLV